MSDIAQEALASFMSLAKGAAAGSVGGPIGAAAGGLIGLASSLVPHVFGEDAKPALAAVAQAITGATTEPEQMAALRSDPAASETFKIRALEIAAEREAAQLNAQTDQITAQVGDLADARKTSVQYVQAGSDLAWTAPVVSVMIVAGFFGTIGGLAYFGKPLDPFVAYAINTLIGTLILGFGQVCNFWLGSSYGSRRKTDMLAAGVKAAPEPNMASEAAK